jgi:transposase-like protein
MKQPLKHYELTCPRCGAAHVCENNADTHTCDHCGKEWPAE